MFTRGNYYRFMTASYNQQKNDFDNRFSGKIPCTILFHRFETTNRMINLNFDTIHIKNKNPYT